MTFELGPNGYPQHIIYTTSHSTGQMIPRCRLAEPSRQLLEILWTIGSKRKGAHSNMYSGALDPGDALKF